eukprot:213875-Chlamydomonas_euryale.AAC.1
MPGKGLRPFCPPLQHFRAYVRRRSYGLKYGPPSDDFPARMEFVGYCDSDFGGTMERAVGLQLGIPS